MFVTNLKLLSQLDYYRSEEVMVATPVRLGSSNELNTR